MDPNCDELFEEGNYRRRKRRVKIQHRVSSESPCGSDIAEDDLSTCKEDVREDMEVHKMARQNQDFDELEKFYKESHEDGMKPVKVLAHGEEEEAAEGSPRSHSLMWVSDEVIVDSLKRRVYPHSTDANSSDESKNDIQDEERHDTMTSPCNSHDRRHTAIDEYEDKIIKDIIDDSNNNLISAKQLDMSLHNEQDKKTNFIIDKGYVNESSEITVKLNSRKVVERCNLEGHSDRSVYNDNRINDTVKNTFRPNRYTKKRFPDSLTISSQRGDSAYDLESNSDNEYREGHQYSSENACLSEKMADTQTSVQDGGKKDISKNSSDESDDTGLECHFSPKFDPSTETVSHSPSGEKIYRKLRLSFGIDRLIGHENDCKDDTETIDKERSDHYMRLQMTALKKYSSKLLHSNLLTDKHNRGSKVSRNHLESRTISDSVSDTEKGEKRKRDVFEGIPNPPPKIVDLKSKNFDALSLSFFPGYFGANGRFPITSGGIMTYPNGYPASVDTMATSLDTIMMYGHPLLATQLSLAAPGQYQPYSLATAQQISQTAGFSYDVLL